jgi:hypothetical protein
MYLGCLLLAYDWLLVCRPRGVVKALSFTEEGASLA